MIDLTLEERYRFSVYLKESAATDKILLKQVDKLNMPGTAKELLSKKMKDEMTAKLIVSGILDSIAELSFKG